MPDGMVAEVRYVMWCSVCKLCAQFMCVVGARVAAASTCECAFDLHNYDLWDTHTHALTSRS